jgi:hypothetical protein
MLGEHDADLLVLLLAPADDEDALHAGVSQGAGGREHGAAVVGAAADFAVAARDDGPAAGRRKCTAEGTADDDERLREQRQRLRALVVSDAALPLARESGVLERAPRHALRRRLLEACGAKQFVDRHGTGARCCGCFDAGALLHGRSIAVCSDTMCRRRLGAE